MPEKKEKPIRKKTRLIFEFKRKFIHSLSALSIPIYYFFFKMFGHQITMLGFLLILLFFLLVEFVRMGEHFKIPIFHFLWRKQEKNRLGGEVYFIIGIIITLSIFDFRIALAAVLMTTLGDMAAALFGIAFGKHYIKKTKKTWEGTSAEFLVDLIIAFFLLDSWVIAVPMALMATIVETFLSHMDDNLTIPIFSGFVGQCLKLILK